MPDPISSSSRSVYQTCDSSNASCADSPSAAPPMVAELPVVTIAPVVITGDAGAQELLRRYDDAPCAAAKQAVTLSCPAIGLSVLNLLEGGGPIASVVTALHTSVLCGKDLRALSDCSEHRESLKTSASAIVADCHDRDGVVKPGVTLSEIICELPQ